MKPRAEPASIDLPELPGQRVGLVMQDAGSTRYDLRSVALKLVLASKKRIDAAWVTRPDDRAMTPP